MRKRAVIDGARFMGKVWTLTAPYWRSEERWRAWGLLGTVVGLTLGLVYMLVLLNEWNREFYNALDLRSYDDFMPLLLRFCVLATVFIVGSVYKLYLTQMLEMRWRTWLTGRYVGAWLDRRAYYRLELRNGADNPDQRIAEDVRYFTTSTLKLSLGLLSSVVTLFSFVFILWTISGPLSFALGETEISIPGYMVWAAVIYAIVGSVLTHYVGRPLIGLNFQQERYEADFRFSLVRLRENAEGVALYRGEDAERTALLNRFEAIRANWWDLMRYTKRLTSFTVGFGQVAVIFPVLVAAPRYFAGAISLGVLMQISSAFSRVENSLAWFITSYDQLANWKASVDRLLSFQQALDEVTAEADRPEAVTVVANGVADIRAEDVDLALPHGPVILPNAAFSFGPGERVLIQGPSGIGKSTLLRAIAGIWPFGRGRIHVPANKRALFLPQKPYIPIGSLREAVSYPAPGGTFDDDAIRDVLRATRLDGFVERLGETQNWSMQMSGGEQQRLAVARALLHKPDWLFLDEATSALDEATEQHLYDLLRERLPDAAIVSIAHRPRVAAFHDKTLELVQSGSRIELATDPSLAASPRPRSSDPIATTGVPPRVPVTAA